MNESLSKYGLKEPSEESSCTSESLVAASLKETLLGDRLDEPLTLFARGFFHETLWGELSGLLYGFLR